VPGNYRVLGSILVRQRVRPHKPLHTIIVDVVPSRAAGQGRNPLCRATWARTARDHRRAHRDATDAEACRVLDSYVPQRRRRGARRQGGVEAGSSPRLALVRQSTIWRAYPGDACGAAESQDDAAARALRAPLTRARPLAEPGNYQGQGAGLSHPQRRQPRGRTSPTSTNCGHRPIQVGRLGTREAEDS
jgi:hypothetical protein